MDNKGRTYVAIDLKSFYASVECVDRGLDPLTTNLVVADKSRTDKTICLAVSPSLKKYGIGGRARLFEVVARIKEVNMERRYKSPTGRLVSGSVSDLELEANGSLMVDYIVATPRMAQYKKCSQKIYDIYLKYVAPEDIYAYSIDEVFIDVTAYLNTYRMTAHELTQTMIHDVLQQTGITATAGIGTNMYLCKIAMDIMAKKMPADTNGVRIAELDEMSYRRQLWNHRPLTAFWRIGKGVAKKLASYGIDTMGKIARCSVENEDLLYNLFGVNAELLIDHAWGWEPCTMDMVKAYRPTVNSLSRGQVLSVAYDWNKARVVVKEMAENIAMLMVAKSLVTNQICLTVSYDAENMENEEVKSKYHGDIVADYYGRMVPKHTHAISNIAHYTSSAREIVEAVMHMYDENVNPSLRIRRLNLTINNVIHETQVGQNKESRQLDLFVDYEAQQKVEQGVTAEQEKERRMQEAQISIKRRFGKNAILKGLNFREGATARERNLQIGGHKG